MQQSWEWVTQHRLPLFLRSDLYSEYKLCKLLTIHSLTHSHTTAATDALKPHKSHSDTRLPRKKSHTELTSQGSGSAVCLPSLNVHGGREDEYPPLNSTPPSPSSAAISHVPLSKSNVELGSKGQQRHSSGSVMSLVSQQRVHEQVNQNVGIPCIVLDDGSPKRAGCSRTRSSGKDSMKMTAEDFEFVGSKSGMSALWKFLRGTMGERNWLFWLDAERIKYFTKAIDQQRCVKFSNCDVHNLNIIECFNAP